MYLSIACFTLANQLTRICEKKKFWSPAIFLKDTTLQNHNHKYMAEYNDGASERRRFSQEDACMYTTPPASPTKVKFWSPIHALNYLPPSPPIHIHYLPSTLPNSIHLPLKTFLFSNPPTIFRSIVNSQDPKATPSTDERPEGGRARSNSESLANTEKAANSQVREKLGSGFREIS